MKRTIYFLEDKTGLGQPKVIQGLINRMILRANDLNLIIRPLDIKSDVLCIVESGNLSIGLMSHESAAHSSADLLYFLDEQECQIIFCTSILRDDLTKVVARYVSQKGYQSVYLKSIWSPQIEVRQLLNYEVSKLEEIVTLCLEKPIAKNSNPEDFLRAI